ncbi:helix-turn-helix domain-containing protein [Paenibacillus phocaensis]|uniref:helix-turn-helix domain-containing protein n=1 Tax=Paenibacillus phocaensis TaxID=1776378 RepID=UPI000839B4A2|nr:helix-turn-helix transcriptional regulator [Paenibacillus phocaensis]
MNFSNVIKHVLVDAGMKPSELARKTGYSAMYIHNLLNGQRRWNEESMKRVCDVLGLELIVQTKEVS